MSALRLDWYTDPGPKHAVVVTGVFDLLHVGHLGLLREAHRRGHALIAGIESDERVRAWKGPARPLNPATERADLLSELRCVDAVFVVHGAPAVSDWTDYVPTLRPLEPYALAITAGDPHTEPKRRAAAELGAQLWEVAHLGGHSTTNLVRRGEG